MDAFPCVLPTASQASQAHGRGLARDLGLQLLGGPQPRPFTPPPAEQASGLLGEEETLSPPCSPTVARTCQSSVLLGRSWHGPGGPSGHPHSLSPGPRKTVGWVKSGGFPARQGPEPVIRMEPLVRSFGLGQFIFFNEPQSCDLQMPGTQTRHCLESCLFQCSFCSDILSCLS